MNVCRELHLKVLLWRKRSILKKNANCSECIILEGLNVLFVILDSFTSWTSVKISITYTLNHCEDLCSFWGLWLMFLGHPKVVLSGRVVRKISCLVAFCCQRTPVPFFLIALWLCVKVIVLVLYLMHSTVFFFIIMDQVFIPRCVLVALCKVTLPPDFWLQERRAEWQGTEAEDDVQFSAAGLCCWWPTRSREMWVCGAGIVSFS